MSKYKFIANKERLVVYMLLVGLTMFSACNSGGSGESQTPSKGFYVTGVSFHIPDWLSTNEYADDKAIVTVSFNKAVDKKSVKSAFFIIRNEQTSEEEVIDYTAHVSKDLKTVVFVSKRSFADTIIKPDTRSSGLLYIISIADGRIIDSTGELLDGDLDGAPGGKYFKVLKRAT
jgi:formylmethanofuran dehydrogenase subunit D